MSYNESLRDKGPKVTNESIKATLIDMANYCRMTRMWVDNKVLNKQ